MEQKTQTKALIKRIKPWMVVALAIGTLILGYYAVIGLKFLSYRSQEETLIAELNALSRSVYGPVRDMNLLQSQLGKAQQELGATKASYASQDTDRLVRLVVDAARDAGVELGQVTIVEPTQAKVGNVSYSVQPLDFLVSGDTTQVLSFVGLLHQRAPTADIVKLNMRGVQDRPVADMRIAVYSSPDYVTVKDTSNVKTSNTQPAGGQSPPGSDRKT